MAGGAERAGNDQDAVIAFLRDPASRAGPGQAVDTIETHGALVFLSGDEALKIKRSVKLPYLDFSTLAKREAFCRREIEINKPNAPEIYRDVVAITREASGQLAIGGAGQPIEWAVRMARFGQEALLSTIAENKGIDTALAIDLAATVLKAHEAADVRVLPEPAAHMRRIVQSVDDSIAAASAHVEGAQVRRLRFRSLADAALLQSAAVMERRAAAGLVRRCHGDLHLGNIVLWKGQPQLFDAIEFDETLATIDLLYDLAFLLMDLERRGQRGAANVVLNRYISGSSRELDIDGLAAMPVFLGLRAAIRAMVAFDRARIQHGSSRASTEAHGVQTLDLALAYLSPAPARLVAIGGLSGTGKTTLAAGLSPRIDPAPGALHLRSDVIRKSLAGVGEFERLPQSAYTPAASKQVYGALAEKARRALGAGHSVVVDAVFDRTDERARIEAVAREAGARFDGVWLEATADLLKARVAARTGDASDATPAVVQKQLNYDVGEISWHRIAATADTDRVLDEAGRALSIGKPDTLA